jgi:membrane protease YdiL (CAAX protease family)
VPWSGWEIAIGLCLVLVVWPAVVMQLLDGVGFFPWFYSVDVIALARDGRSAQALLAQARLVLWLSCLAFPFQVVTIPVLFNLVSGTRPYQLGLTCHRGLQNLLVGGSAAFLLTPLVYGIHIAVTVLFSRWGQGPGEDHPLVLLRHGIRPTEVAALVFTVLVAAPVLEELLVRGVLQRWCARRPWGGHLALALALATALAKRWDGITRALGHEPGLLLHELSPALFVLALVPSYLVVWKVSRSPFGPALFGTALLFAAGHAVVWPSPVALFVLALGLGQLAHRTQSLIGPIVVHASFNAVGCVLFFLS